MTEETNPTADVGGLGLPFAAGSIFAEGNVRLGERTKDDEAKDDEAKDDELRESMRTAGFPAPRTR